MVWPTAPVFLLMPANDLSIPKRGDVTAHISGDVKLELTKFQPAPLVPARHRFLPQNTSPLHHQPRLLNTGSQRCPCCIADHGAARRSWRCPRSQMAPTSRLMVISWAAHLPRSESCGRATPPPWRKPGSNLGNVKSRFRADTSRLTLRWNHRQIRAGSYAPVVFATGCPNQSPLG